MHPPNSEARVFDFRARDPGRAGGGWKWTEWDLNPRLPPCEGGDLPLIYRPSRTMTNPGARNRFRCSRPRGSRDRFDSAGQIVPRAAAPAPYETPTAHRIKTTHTNNTKRCH